MKLYLESIRVELVMSDSSIFLEQAFKINEEFHNEIRRRDINQRFTERRKQLIDEIRNTSSMCNKT
jgi:hypothetical protein